MKYNRQKYNLGGYNRFAGIQLGVIESKCDFNAALITLIIPASGTISGEANFSGDLAPGNIKCTIQGVCAFGAAQGKVYYVENIDLSNLTGIVLAPGERLIIDTDSMEVTINGVNKIGFLTSGSTFFKLGSSGTIIYSDTDTEREALLTVGYADRWI